MITSQKQAARKFKGYWTFQRGSEKGEDQQFWNTLLRDVLGVADVEQHIKYQVPVQLKDTTKFLDAWIPETRVLIEHKSRSVKLDAPQSGHGGLTPYEQAVEYDNARPFDEKARWIVTCNFDEFRIYDRAKPLAPPLRLGLGDLPKEAHRLAFLVNPKEKAIDRELEISVRAGRIVGEIYDALLKQVENVKCRVESGGDAATLNSKLSILNSINRLCVRLVFCLYAEDADLFPKDCFKRFVDASDARRLRIDLQRLFQTLDTPTDKRDPYLEPELCAFPYTNGGLFRNAAANDIPPLTEEIRKLLISASQFDWRDITPTIFGALFESTLNPVTRRAGGMVYTSVENIHKVIDPLFLEDLTRREEECVATAPSPSLDTVASSFAYNDRSEVVAAQIGTNSFAHAYDFIGNQTLFAENAVTNAYTHNALNQIETSQIISALSASLREIYHDLDGNLTNDCVFTYSYDAANRLSSVSSNGVSLVANQYDYKGRRIRKTTPTTETTFVYDGWHLIHETVATVTGATTNTTEIQYFWGADISETLQGAGGVGGLLAVSLNNNFYFPTYDNNGNITKYIDESGNIVAAYEYDDFGKTISQSGSLADFFRHRFSTKYFDSETGLYYYGYRFYSPSLMRWLNRDPIEEEGGLNLYGFCGNNAMCKYDKDGRAHFEVRRLSGLPAILNYSCFAQIIGIVPAMILDLGLADKLNIEILHEHLFYDDGTNIGYNDTGEFSEAKKGYSRRDLVEYDDCIMKEAQNRIPKPPYSLIGIGNPKFNCQDYADSLRREYNRIKDSKEIKCKCKR